MPSLSGNNDGNKCFFVWQLLPQPNQQNKTKQLGWCGIIIGKKKTPHHHGYDYNFSHFEAT